MWASQFFHPFLYPATDWCYFTPKVRDTIYLSPQNADHDRTCKTTAQIYIFSCKL